LERSALIIDETISEINDKIESFQEMTVDENKQDESDVETYDKEIESTENSEQVVEESLLETAISECKEETNIENFEIIQSDTVVEQREIAETTNEEITTETAEKDLSTSEGEKSSGEEITSISFDNIKIKEEPLDDYEQPENEIFDFANVEIKKEPIDIEGIYLISVVCVSYLCKKISYSL